jgi:epoxyqueuosine reductase
VSEGTVGIHTAAEPPGLYDRVVGPVARVFFKPALFRRLYLAPSLPAYFRNKYRPGGRWWGDDTFDVPESLQTVPGIRRNPQVEQEAFAKSPVHDWLITHPEAVQYIFSHGWRTFLTTSPRVQRANRRLKRAAAAPPAAARVEWEPAAFSKALKEKGKSLELSAIGVAEYDEKYTFSSFLETQAGDRVIVVALDQSWEATNTAPSIASEKAAFVAYAELTDKATTIAEWIQAQGYKARVHDFQGENIILHYAVQSGLGQMGINGQVLTPNAGSRCRITSITTDAPLAVDQPVDFGITKICDECKVCVRRCPSGAIPARRTEYRGVEKAKLNMARCAPVVAQTHGCAVCMKVCPIQRYGLGAVLEEYNRSGKILGKDTDELEGYNFHGTYYPAGERPRLADEFLAPPGLVFDPTRTGPKPGASRQFR